MSTSVDPKELVGAIDIGTNSVLLLIASSTGEGVSPVLERATITRLGAGVDRTRRLDSEACTRTLDCLRNYAAELAAHKVSRLDVVGTSALRDALGGEEFLAEATRILNVRPRVIAGSVEAELTFNGSLSGLDLRAEVTVFDVGGGSTEIISGRAANPRQLRDAVSLDIGSVRLFERHVRSDPPSTRELEAVGADIETELAKVTLADPSAELVGVAGTVTTLAAIHLGLDAYDSARVHGHVLERDAIMLLAERLGHLNLEQRKQLAGLEPKRADVIVVGAEIVKRVLLWSGAPRLVVSDRGVRWGLVEELARTPPR